MPPKARGQIRTHKWADGRTVTYKLRIPYRGSRVHVDLGTNIEGWSRQRAQTELDRIMQLVERGTWEPATPQRHVEDRSGELFDVTAHRWATAKRATIDDSTRDQYRWAINKLRPALGQMRTVDIEGRHVRDLTTQLLKPADGKPLAARSVNIVLRILRAILEEAVEDKLIPSNPVTARHRVKAERKQRSFLEADQARDMLDAASSLEAEARRDYKIGRRAIVATLLLAGLRREELCALTVGDLDLHHARLRVADAKTEAGIREVELTMWLVDELRAHLQMLQAHGLPMGPNAWLFPTATGGQRDPDRLNDRIIQKAATRASEDRAKRKLVGLPEPTTPHTLRRTYASLALSAGRDPRFVMAQLGHTDPAFTLRVYAQVMKRQRQDDALIWELMRFADEPAARPDRRVVRAQDQAHDQLQTSDQSGRITA
jgi:integrase